MAHCREILYDTLSLALCSACFVWSRLTQPSTLEVDVVLIKAIFTNQDTKKLSNVVNTGAVRKVWGPAQTQASDYQGLT